MKNVCILFCLQMLIFSPLLGQQRYSCSTASQTYKNLDNPIVLNDGTNPEAFDEFMVESDFWISYFDDKVYSILVTNGGQIYFGNQFEFVDLLPVRLKMKFDSQISYQKIGTPDCGNRILKIEYKNMGFRCDSTGNYFTNVQLWMYENSGIIEMHFGESSDNPETYSTRDPDCYGRTYYGCRLKLNFDWSVQPYGDANNPKFHQGKLNNSYYSEERIPSNGIVYQFDPELLSGNDFKMSPNPARSFTKIFRPNECGDFEIRIFDINGKLISKRDFIGNQEIINTSNLLIGVYFVQVFDKKNNKTFVEKLLIL